ncbi:TIGR03619 family F420-dependent LLM class oxidoreductase [Myxococcota bacterium]|nr:TIGR03619 family F420-dependent LLM class oxidoreductase [Myxococcota bacterium]
MPPPAFGVAIPSYGPFSDGSTLTPIAQAAEDLGYADAWFADHVVIPGYAAEISGTSWLEPLACCLVGLGATRTLRFGTDVLVAPYRNPVLVAKMAASADRLSGGRLTLGLGTGYIHGEFEALGAPDYARRGQVTDEYIQVLRCLFESSGACSFAGEFVQFDDIHFDPTPLQEPLPLWVGGNRNPAQRRAAALGDGWHPLFPTPEAYQEGRDHIVSLRERGTDGFTFSYSCPGTRVLAPGEPLPEIGGYESIPDLPDEYHYAPPMPRTEQARPRFIGTPDQLVEDLEAFVEAGVEHFTLRFFTDSEAMTCDAFIDQMRRFAEEVIPQLE